MLVIADPDHARLCSAAQPFLAGGWSAHWFAKHPMFPHPLEAGPVEPGPSRLSLEAHANRCKAACKAAQAKSLVGPLT